MTKRFYFEHLLDLFLPIASTYTYIWSIISVTHTHTQLYKNVEETWRFSIHTIQYSFVHQHAQLYLDLTLRKKQKKKKKKQSFQVDDPLSPTRKIEYSWKFLGGIKERKKDGMGRGRHMVCWFDTYFDRIGEHTSIAPCIEDMSSCGGRLLVLQWVVSQLEIWRSQWREMAHCLVLEKHGFDCPLLLSFPPSSP